jgi:hypothetical protein
MHANFLNFVVTAGRLVGATTPSIISLSIMTFSLTIDKKQHSAK